METAASRRQNSSLIIIFSSRAFFFFYIGFFFFFFFFSFIAFTLPIVGQFCDRTRKLVYFFPIFNNIIIIFHTSVMRYEKYKEAKKDRERKYIHNPNLSYLMACRSWAEKGFCISAKYKKLVKSYFLRFSVRFIQQHVVRCHLKKIINMSMMRMREECSIGIFFPLSFYH